MAGAPPPHVSLPMYNLPEMQAANSAFWAAVQAELGRMGVHVAEPVDFTRKPVPDAIGAGTLFSQVCGWPLQTVYAGQASIIGVPVYKAAHCEGPYHAGVFVVREDSGYGGLADLQGCRFVFNSVHSNSGMNLPRLALAEMGARAPFFGSVEETHSQPGNLARVADGSADATCVDCVTYAFVRRYRPAVARHLRVLAVTAASPAIPFVTGAGTGPGLRAALAAALTAVGRAAEWADVRDGLLLRDIVPGSTVDYGVQVEYAAAAARLGYAVLR